jgi:hypothetical protein
VISKEVCEETCSRGHATRFVVASPFYVLLYNDGVDAFLADDTRSATLNFYSAWETFIAQVVQQLLDEAQVEEELPKKWRLRSSAAQLGMYCALYAAKLKAFPKPFNDDVTTIRNRVAHGDSIPTLQEAGSVGEEIGRQILEIKAALKLDEGGDKSQADRVNTSIAKAGATIGDVAVHLFGENFEGWILAIKNHIEGKGAAKAAVPDRDDIP